MAICELRMKRVRRYVITSEDDIKNLPTKGIEQGSSAVIGTTNEAFIFTYSQGWIRDSTDRYHSQPNTGG